MDSDFAALGRDGFSRGTFAWVELEGMAIKVILRAG